jgi:hypothetical protein
VPTSGGITRVGPLGFSVVPAGYREPRGKDKAKHAERKAEHYRYGNPDRALADHLRRTIRAFRRGRDSVWFRGRRAEVVAARGPTNPSSWRGERLSWMSSWLPWATVSEDSVEDCQELSRDGDEGDQFWSRRRRRCGRSRPGSCLASDLTTLVNGFSGMQKSQRFASRRLIAGTQRARSIEGRPTGPGILAGP